VGAFARGLLLRGECTMELVLMCTGSYTHSVVQMEQLCCTVLAFHVTPVAVVYPLRTHCRRH